MKVKTSYKTALALAVALVLAAPATGAAGKKNAAAQPFSDAFGQSFGYWLRDFWGAAYTGAPALQPNGVYFLPVPAATSTELWNNKSIGTGEMSVTVKPGTKIVLGVLAWLNETYDPAWHIADDTPWPMANFLPPEGEAVITLDGVELINAGNSKDFYYGPVSFEPPIMYAAPTDYHSIGIVSVQGIGIVLLPMTPGEHTLTLYSWDRWQGFYGPSGQGWFNTWHITVAQPKK